MLLNLLGFPPLSHILTPRVGIFVTETALPHA
jgi:hypothetical protein